MVKDTQNCRLQKKEVIWLKKTKTGFRAISTQVEILTQLLTSWVALGVLLTLSVPLSWCKEWRYKYIMLLTKYLVHEVCSAHFGYYYYYYSVLNTTVHFKIHPRWQVPGPPSLASPGQKSGWNWERLGEAVMRLQFSIRLNGIFNNSRWPGNYGICWRCHFRMDRASNGFWSQWLENNNCFKLGKKVQGAK